MITKVLTVRLHPEITKSAQAHELLWYLHSEIQKFVDQKLTCDEISSRLEPAGVYSVSFVDESDEFVDIVQSSPRFCHLHVFPYTGIVH
jgi:hypothetical protein